MSNPCYESDLTCNGETTTIETCCMPGETTAECAARHRAAVDDWLTQHGC